MSSVDTTGKLSAGKTRALSQAHPWRPVISWVSTWEIYPILFCAILLHFYGLTTTEFDTDQAVLASFSRGAVTHGLIPVTSNMASIGIANPPGYGYLLMPIAALTANPLAVVIFTALLNIIAVMLTYVFTRRYYGRLAGTVAALLYATTFQDVFFGRFIWQPNLLPFFAIFFIWTLFWGAVEHRPGWLAIALPLLGFMLQLHATSMYLALPLTLTLALAYKTVRWRDLVIGLGLFALMFSTYVIWEASTHFADLQILLSTSHNAAHFDSDGLHLYLNFLVPYVIEPYFPLSAHPQSLLSHLLPLLKWERWAMYAITGGGLLVAGLGVLGLRRIQLMPQARVSEGADLSAPVNEETSRSSWQKLWHWWSTFSASPQRCGLLLLLAWQIPPLLLISRHSIPLQFQYFMVFLPGPFILIGLLFSQLTSWGGQIKYWGRFLRLFIPACSCLLVLLQLAGSFGWFFDEVHGYHPQGVDSNTLQDVQGAITAADRLAQSRHLQHVYIDTNSSTYESLKYLAGQMQTPATVLNGSHCLVVPALSQGPVVMLLGPADTLDEILLNRFASATLVSKPSRLDGAPFHLYIVQPLTAAPASQASFAHTLTLNVKQPGMLAWNDSASPAGPTMRLLETRWTNLKNLPAAYSTLYTYHFDARYSGHDIANQQPDSVDCRFTSLAPGEQLLVPFQLPQGSLSQPTSLVLSGSTWFTYPYELHHGPFWFESILDQQSTPLPFRSSSGGENIVVQASHGDS